MSPSLKCEIVPLDEVPLDDRIDAEMQGPVVLVVDDEPLVADTLSVILQRAGFRAMTAYDGNTALTLASHMTPQLLISDIAMPDMNGVELAIALVGVIPQCKVLLFSGHATSADLLSALDAGHEFPLLAKPVHPVEMLNAVTETLEMPAIAPKRVHHLADVIEIRRSA